MLFIRSWFLCKKNDLFFYAITNNFCHLVITATVLCIHHIYSTMYTSHLQYYVYITATVLCIHHIYSTMYTSHLQYYVYFTKCASFLCVYYIYKCKVFCSVNDYWLTVLLIFFKLFAGRTTSLRKRKNVNALSRAVD